VARVRVLILRAAGTNCDLEAQHAWELAGAEATRVHVRRLIEQPRLLHEYQVLTLPGGFSYGDDIAAGRIWAAQLQRQLIGDLREFIDAGKLVLGICNGFQVLVQAGILPLRQNSGAGRGNNGGGSGNGNGGGRGDNADAGGHAGARTCTVTYNEPPGFQDRWVYLRADTDRCVFLERGQVYEMPIAHGEGRVAFSTPDDLQTVIDARQNALVYCGPRPGEPDLHGQPHNPNGSTADLAGLCDETGRVLGLMPHPERFVTWTQHPCWTSQPARPEGDGMSVFRRAVAYFA